MNTERKYFRLSEEACQMIDGRDKSIYRKEYQYVEAAIRYFAEKEEREQNNSGVSREEFQNGLEELKQELRQMREAAARNMLPERPEIFAEELPSELKNILT